MPFSKLGLSEKVLSAVSAAGYTNPTPIQEQAIPHVLARRDVLGIAQTGTGKTAAFTLPMLTMLEQGRARARMPRTLLNASGLAVGLPEGQMGNSEVGHLNLGAGRVVMQDLPRITDSIATGDIKTNAALNDLIATLKAPE